MYVVRKQSKRGSVKQSKNGQKEVNKKRIGNEKSKKK